MKRLRRVVVRENRIYIMPTTRGFLFLSVVVVLILTAATYNNNLIFLLAFVLFSVFAISMLQTHYNLKGVRLRFVGADEAFQEENLGLLFHILQKKARARQGLQIRSSNRRFKSTSETLEDLKPTENFKAARLDVFAARRGVHAVPEVVLETRFPLGLFRAWKVFRPVGQMVVFPKPVVDERLEAATSEEGEAELGLRNTPDGDFGELKDYLPGESYHQIAWKHYARTRELYTKLHWGSEHRHYAIPWSASRDGIEAHLQKMSGWVRQAFEENASFELQTPQGAIAPGRGMEHARRCWRHLAEFDGRAG